MSSPHKDSFVPFPKKPIEIKLADVLFFAVRKNLMLFKDLENKHAHYSIFIRGSLMDFHETLEDKHVHIPFAEIEFDWQFLIERIAQELWENQRSILQIIKTDDPKWADLRVEFIPVQLWTELFSPLTKGRRWNVDETLLEKLDSSIVRSRLEDLSDHELIIGTGERYFVISNGIECFLFDTERILKILERSIKLSIRKIRLYHFTLQSVFWYAKMRFQILINSAIRHFRKKIRKGNCKEQSWSSLP